VQGMVFVNWYFLWLKYFSNIFMKLINTGLLFLVALLFACTQQGSEAAFQSIQLKTSQDILPISSFANKIDYIELQVSEANIELGDIEALEIIGSDLIVKHRMSGKSSFLRFTGNGDFVIELVGEKTTHINEAKDLIAFEDGYAVLAGNGIFKVSRDGKYKGQLVHGTMPGSRFFYSGGAFQVINETNTGDLIQTFPAQTKERVSLTKLPEPVQRMTYSAVAYLGHDGIHFYSALSDTIFEFGENSVQPAYTLYESEMPTFAKLCRNIGDRNDAEALRFLRENEHVIVRKYLENKQYIFVTYWKGSTSTSVIVNKKRGSTRYFGHGVNDLDGGVWDKPYYLSDKNELYIPITAYKVGGHKISNKKEKRFAKLQERIASSGNPVVMRCKLR
jgi:hypothetical protein